ncbi:hypothetical protein JN01_0195 [Entomoplasma freundtii]|uniref:Uncharacterized protein n=1 Tax=Entomoplasma freundtii TaxID=74700 RepID=A0A2K8NS63_9MOLU|nr:DUF3800 domain-containing protein [Entomoplasma freundtii]ATZ16594.1 hypothetical protein EFREU_v1c05730 [Entomoplasma freundtii]TDY58240.1 hypothetical protein JN01_0195 [Entomoplasma freundtii]
MKLKFCLDESGNTRTAFFAVGGLYYFFDETNNKKGEHILNYEKERQMWANLKRLSRTIKRTNHWPDLKSELKANQTNHHNKVFLFSRLQDYGQRAISIICNNEAWDQHKRNQADHNLNLKYNYLLKVMLGRCLQSLLPEIKLNCPDNHLEIELKCDERGTGTQFARSLESYLNVQLSTVLPGFTIAIRVLFLNSEHNYSIQYADFIVNLVYLSSYAIFNIPNLVYNDTEILEIYRSMHTQFLCHWCQTFEMEKNLVCLTSSQSSLDLV